MSGLGRHELSIRKQRAMTARQSAQPTKPSIVADFNARLKKFDDLHKSNQWTPQASEGFEALVAEISDAGFEKWNEKGYLSEGGAKQGQGVAEESGVKGGEGGMKGWEAKGRELRRESVSEWWRGMKKQ
ncbi:hypothetical protein LTR95_000637 [Oleoguttula sp. CCFEE 5521]